MVWVNNRICPTASRSFVNWILIGTCCPAVNAIPVAWVQFRSLGPVEV